MNSSKKKPAPKPLGQGASSWRSSLYEEPLWLSLAWIIGPLALAALGIIFVVR